MVDDICPALSLWWLDGIKSDIDKHFTQSWTFFNSWSPEKKKKTTTTGMQCLAWNKHSMLHHATGILQICSVPIENNGKIH